MFQHLSVDTIVKQPNTYKLMVEYNTAKKVKMDKTADTVKGLITSTLTCNGGYCKRFHRLIVVYMPF